MNRLSERLAKVEDAHRRRHPQRRVERHIITGDSHAERQARIAEIVAGSTGNVLHVFRTIVGPDESVEAS